MALGGVPQKLLQSLVLTETTQMSVFTLLHGTSVPAASTSLRLLPSRWDGRTEYFGRMSWGRSRGTPLRRTGAAGVAGGAQPGRAHCPGFPDKPSALLQVGYPPGSYAPSLPLKGMFSPKTKTKTGFKAVLTGFQLLFITLVFHFKNFSLNIESISRTWERGFFSCCSIFVR